MPTGFSLSGSGLKWFAMLTMLLDHIGAVLLEPHLADPAAAAVYLVLRCGADVSCTKCYRGNFSYEKKARAL